jgi:LacI family transcriptional regulator
VAGRAGVHAATASRALNPATRGLVNAATARRVLAAAAELGYAPNTIARALRTARTSTVGVLVPDLINPIFPPIVRGIEDALGEAAHTALLADTDNDERKEREAVSALQARQVDGLLIASARRVHPLVDELHDAGTPLVLISRVTDRTDVPSVVEEGEEGVAEAFEHLWQLGHRRIAHLAGPDGFSTGRVRAEAFAHAVAAKGGSPDDAIVRCERYAIDAGASAMEQLLDGNDRVTAVIAANDLIALGALATLAARDLRCPEDLSLIGFNDMPFLEYMDPPLTTVHVAHYELGFEAARMLLDRIGDPADPVRHRRLPAHLVVRGSTAAPRG